MSFTKDRRWWSVPKTFSGFSLWRLTNPFLDTVDSTNENKANGRKEDEQDYEDEEMKHNHFRKGDSIDDDDKENNVDTELNHERFKKLRRSRSRSRSSSLSRKSVERSTMSIDVKDDKQQLSNSSNSSSAAALPEISFSFYNEREDEYIIVEPAVIVKQNRQDGIVVDKSDAINDKRKSEVKIDLDRDETKVTNDEEEEEKEREEEDDISVHDNRLRQVVDNETGDSCQTEETRHVSSITLTVRSSANYTNTEELKSITGSLISEETAKENDYETLKEESTTTGCFTSRKDSLSSSASFPIYAIIEKNHNDDYNNRSSTLPSSLGVGNNEAVPELPNPDWEETNSDDNPDYAELTTPVDNHSLETEDNKDYAECEEPKRIEIERLRNEDGEELDGKDQYEDMEYCQHRAELKPSKRRVTLLRNRKRPSIGKVRLRINRTWMRVKCWWLEERVKIGEVISRHTKSDNNEDVCYAESVETAAEKEDNRISPVMYVIQEDAVTCDASGRGGTTGEIVLQQQQPETTTEQDDENDDYVDLKSDGGDSSLVASTVSTMRVVKRRKNSNNSGIGSPLPALSRSSSIAAFRRSRFIPAGQNGFEELRRYIKQGGDFCKELSAILQERSEAETQYAKTLSKLSCKLIKATKEAVNTVNTAWQRTAVEMEAQSEVHRAFATALSEEVVKPLKQLVESQHRIRKSVETAVDKTGKGLAEWRSAECKSKKQSFISARENEKMQDAMLDVRIAGGGGGGIQNHHHTGNKLSTSTLHLHNQKVVSDKENAKMESKRRKAEESVKKADVEYYTYCIRAERARLEWESAILRGSHCFQALEEERLQHLKDLASCYLRHYKDMGPKLVQSAHRLTEPTTQINVVGDLETVVSLREAGQPLPEQLLPDFYAEHITLAMNKERRRQALVKLLHLIRQDIERERRGKQGVENLARALKQTPNFGAEDSQQNVTEKLHHMRSMLAYLEAARYKVQSALAELEGRTKESHPLASHIHITRDRQGLQQSILKVPTWVRKESIEIADSPDWTDRGAADGNSVQPDSDFDEFSSQGSEHDYQTSVLSQFPVLQEEALTQQTTVTTTVSASRCKALYHYAANLYDELNLSPGDVINIHDKQADGWWLGELNGVVGIFPATYVEEIK